MKLKKISILFILLPLCIFFTACSKENDNAPKQSENIIDFEQGNMNFTEGAGEQTFSFTTNTAWVVSVASTRNRGVPWCTVAPTSGNAGSHTIKVTTTPNETYDDRSVTVTLKAGAEVKSFVVSQKQKDALLLTNDKFEVDQAGGTVTVEVKSNVSYTATIGEECKDWIKESNSTRALSTTTKSYTVAMNEDGKKREGSIIFSDGSLTETVHIYQAGGSIILLSQNDCHVSASGEEITVELRSNCDYEVVMPSVDWIKETMTRGMSSHTLHYTVAPNDSYDGRKTEIIYRDKSDSSIADTLTILQAQKDAIIISEKEVKVGSEGGTVEVKIDANVDFEMQLPDVEWISETSTRGLSTHKKYLKIAENTGETSRTAEVVFKNTTSGIEETLTVSQSAKGKRVKVHVEKAGTLSDYIAESEKLNVEELEVSGNLGGKDIAFIREMAGTYNHANTEGKLVYLDMTEANIVADGEYYLPNSSGKEYLPTENTIGERMFTSRGLQTILLPKSVTSIDDRAFSSCHSLNKVVIYENSVKTIGMAAFEYCSSLADIVLPEGVTTIARSAFWGCSSLSRIDLPEGVTTIGHSAFYGCEKLSSVKLPNSLTTIEGFAFLNCSKLKVVTGGMGLLYIKERAFCGCINLSDICLKSIQEIESCAFKQCSIHNLIIRKGAKIDWGAFGYSSIKNVYVNSESSNLNENAFYNSVVDNFILPVNYINPQFIKIPWEQQSVFVGFICFLYEDNGIHYGLIRSEKRTFVRFKYKPQEEKFEIGNVVTYEYKKRYSKHFNGNNIVYTLDNANQGFNVLNLNYKPENKDKDSSEILLEYIKNDYWYKQGHKSKNYILSNEIISEYFKKKDYIGLQRRISEYVQQYDIKKACEQYFVTIEEDFRYRVGRDDYYSCCEVGKIEKYSTDTYIQKILPKYGKCLYEDKGYMAADKMAIDTTGYKEEASIKQIQIRNNALKYYNPICHEHELYEEILSDYISEQKENEYLLEKLFHYNTLVNYGKSYFSHDDLEKVRMDFMSFASHIL